MQGRILGRQIVIDRMQNTSDGPQREISVLNELPKKSKWSDEEMTIIMDILRTYSSLSLKSIRAQLQTKYGIEISEGVLGKIRRAL